MRRFALFLLAGTAFGLILSRSGAADYDLIQRMFLFQSFQLYGILATAVVLTGLGLRALRRLGRTLGGEPLRVEEKATHRGTVIGAALFGAGWSITGMCPGPIFVNLGEGKVYALGALLGALGGAYLVGCLYPRLGPRLGLRPGPRLSLVPVALGTASRPRESSTSACRPPGVVERRPQQLRRRS